MDIGSAKPDQKTLSSIKHHLIDICPPNDIYSAGRYIEDAIKIVKDILSRKKIPLIVGGTMFYIKALLDGMNKLPPADPSLRSSYVSKYADLAEEERSIALHKELQQLDEKTAARTSPSDIHRVIRALELIERSGTTLDELFAAKENNRIQGLRDLAKDNAWQIIEFALNYEDRAILRQKIAERFHQFIANGLIEEVKQLRIDYPDLDLNFPSIRAIGYRQLWEYLLELDASGIDENSKEGIILRDAMIEKAITATRQFAKRQVTWLRSWGGEEGNEGTRVTQDIKEDIKEHKSYVSLDASLAASLNADILIKQVLELNNS